MQKILLASALVAAFGAAQAAPATYNIDPTHTFVNFEAIHVGTSTLRGRFDKKEGSVSFDKEGKTGSADITIDIGSVSTGVPALDTHLKSPDFFNAVQFGTARFVGDKFTFTGDKVSEISGNLTLLGKTNPVVLKATNFNCYMSPILKREVCGGDFTTTLVRSLYGMSYGLQYGLPDNIGLLIQIEAIKQ